MCRKEDDVQYELWDLCDVLSALEARLDPETQRARQRRWPHYVVCVSRGCTYNAQSMVRARGVSAPALQSLDWEVRRVVCWIAPR